MDYEQFRQQYEQMHRASVPAQPTASNSSRLMKVGIGAMFVCAAALSGVHTIPTVRAGIEVTDLITPTVANVVALGSFVAVELAMLLAGYGVSKSKYLNGGITVGAVIMALVANISSISRALSGTDAGTIITTLFMGLFAPALAFMAGTALVGLRDENREASADEWRAYRERLREFEKQVNAAWAKYQASARPSIPERSNGNSIGNQAENFLPSESTLGHRKRPNATELVNDYLKNNPEALELDGLELARVVGVGKSTAYTVLKEWKENPPSTNGHGNSEHE